jgi:hypothetical protein
MVLRLQYLAGALNLAQNPVFPLFPFEKAR